MDYSRKLELKKLPASNPGVGTIAFFFLANLTIKNSVQRVKQVRHYLLLLMSVAAFVVTWTYVYRVLQPWEYHFNVEIGTQKAALGDLYSPWFGSRSLLLYGRNPYGPEVTHDIQVAFYGAEVHQTFQPGTRIIDEQRFAYPVYIVFFFGPFVHFGFETLQSWALVVLALSVVCTVKLWLSVARWKTSMATAWATMAFFLASPQIAQGLRLRQVGVVDAFFLALAAWLAMRTHLLLTGAMLAICTIKPQMTLLPLLWLLIWSLGDVRKRWKLPIAFGVVLAVLFGAGDLLLPGWTHYFLAGLVAYRKYGPVTSLLQLTLGNTTGSIVGIGLIAAVAAWSWKRRKCEADSEDFVNTLAWFLIVGSVAMPLMVPFNQILLILPALILLRDWKALPVAARIGFVVLVSWGWIVPIVLIASRVSVSSPRILPLLPSALVLFVPFILPILLISRRGPASSQAVRT